MKSQGHCSEHIHFETTGPKPLSKSQIWFLNKSLNFWLGDSHNLVLSVGQCCLIPPPEASEIDFKSAPMIANPIRGAIMKSTKPKARALYLTKNELNPKVAAGIATSVKVAMV